jgi:hypothetical protein
MLHLHEDDIRMIQIDGPRRKVYIKFINNERIMAVLQPIRGPLEYHHDTGEMSMENVETAGMGIRHFRVANMPPEVHYGSSSASRLPAGNIVGVLHHKL